MSGLRERLPSAQSLFAFECAARALNFKSAAAELNVTQSSISHAVRKLERHLNVALFIRENRGVRLTEEGEILFRAVDAGFGGINEAIAAIDGSRERFLTIALSTSMATHWLMPQLRDLYRDLPSVRLRILTTDRNLEPSGNIDLTIRRLPLTSARAHTWHLANETVFPVCSARYLVVAPPLAAPHDLPGQRLLIHREPHRSRISWDDFFHSFGLDPAGLKADLVFHDHALALQAAAAGEGVALGWTITGQYLLDEGFLLRPIPQSLTTDSGFFLMANEHAPPKAEAHDVVEWLLERSGPLRQTAKGTG